MLYHRTARFLSGCLYKFCSAGIARKSLQTSSNSKGARLLRYSVAEGAPATVKHVRDALLEGITMTEAQIKGQHIAIQKVLSKQTVKAQKVR